MKNTVVIVESDEGKIFGGYTPVSWDKTSLNKKDPSQQTFLFSITNNEKYPKIHDDHRAIYCNVHFGPAFGQGSDFYIGKESNKQRKSNVVAFPTTFNNGNYTLSQEGTTALCGSTNDNCFLTKQWEVYQIIWK